MCRIPAVGLDVMDRKILNKNQCIIAAGIGHILLLLHIWLLFSVNCNRYYNFNTENDKQRDYFSRTDVYEGLRKIKPNKLS